MAVKPLSTAQLRRVCDPASFAFETTAELNATNPIIGQPRGIRAIEFGIGISSQGYNIFVMGPTGTGRAATLKHFLEERTRQAPVPSDWIYVNSFSAPHQPRAISLPPGEGAIFQSRLNQLINNLRADLPKAFRTEAYRAEVDEIEQDYEKQQEAALNLLQQKASANDLAIIRTASGLEVAPIEDGKVIAPETFAGLPVDMQQRLNELQDNLSEELDDVLEEQRELERGMRQEIDRLNRRVAEAATAHHFDQLAASYKGHEAIKLYLSELRQDVLERLEDFNPDEANEQEISWRRYEANLFVDNRATQGAPVIIEDNPTFYNLMGRIEYEMSYGALSTHFTNMKAGSLHKANGGYLVIDMRALRPHMDAWEALKRALKSRRIMLQTQESAQGTPQMVTKSLDPEPIALAVKVILLGSPSLYYHLYDSDEDFSDLFKVRADFDTEMPRDPAHEMEYALYTASRCREEKLPHFDRTAVAQVVEFGSWLCEHQDRLSTRFGAIADVIREASYWAGQNGRETVTASDVKTALDERRLRSSRVEERLREEIAEGSLLITTTGAVVGQVNSLSVVDLGDYSFGQPGRITARTFMGENGVVNIEREVDMSGPIHNKGLLTLTGYLGGQYAERQPLSLSASLTFEQNYSDVEGDSAAAAELYALLSSLSSIPVRQGIAVTGSVNQRGEIQPVGGISEKIEGFYAVCQVLGLTGNQGVIIPAANVSNLMLHDSVIAAVAQGEFHIWPIKTIDEGIELLMEKPAGQRDVNGRYPPISVHHAVQARLLQLARELKSFGDDDDEDKDEDES